MNIKICRDNGLSKYYDKLDLCNISKLDLKSVVGLTSPLRKVRNFIESKEKFTWYQCPFISDTSVGKLVLNICTEKVSYRNKRVHYGEGSDKRYILIEDNGKCSLYVDDEATRDCILDLIDLELSKRESSDMQIESLIELNSIQSVIDKLTNT